MNNNNEEDIPPSTNIAQSAERELGQPQQEHPQRHPSTTDQSKVAASEMQGVIERVRRGSLAASVEAQTVALLARIKQASEPAYEVQRMKLREANTRVPLATIDRLVKAHEKSLSDPATHNTYAKEMLKQLTVKGHPPVTHETTLYVLDPARNIWVPREQPQVMQRVADLFDGAAYCARAGDYKAIAQLVVDSATDSAFFANAPVGLACLDRFYRVTGDEVCDEPLTPDHRQRVRLEFAPAPGETPLFNQFLSETFRSERQGEEQEQVKLLQEIAGAIMTGIMYRFHKAALFYDPYGRAGKGTMERILRRLVPENFVRAVSPLKWGSEYYVMQLSGARLNVVGELSETQRIPADCFKSVLGGDLLTGRHAYGRPTTVKNEAGHVFMSNSLPAATEHSEALFERWLIVEFPNSRLKSGLFLDSSLAERIVAQEMPGIAAWALEGAQRLLRQGKFSSSMAHRRLIAASRLANSSAESFIDEACDLGNKLKIRRADLYANYKNWCISNGHVAQSKGRFKATLERCLHLKITSASLDGYEIFRGVDMKKAAEGQHVDPDF